MSTHLITDPDTRPAAPPAESGWDGLSAALTDEVPVIAERCVAEHFAAAAAYLATITIDDRVRAWMPVMPCQDLWL